MFGARPATDCAGPWSRADVAWRCTQGECPAVARRRQLGWCSAARNAPAAGVPVQDTAGGPPRGDPPSTPGPEPPGSGQRLERVLEVVLGDAAPERGARLVRPAVVEAAPHPGVD